MSSSTRKAERFYMSLTWAWRRGVRFLPPVYLYVGGGKALTFSLHIISYIDDKTGKHRPMDEGGKGLNGTARYASINAHEGRTQSRRDDMESLGYMLLYLARGHVPWQGLPQASENKNEDIKKVKIETPVEEFCCNFPAAEALAEHIVYARGLDYDTKPDYAYLKGLYQDTLNRYGVEENGAWDWNLQSDDKEGVQIMAGDEAQWIPVTQGGVEGKQKPEKGGACACVVS